MLIEFSQSSPRQFLPVFLIFLVSSLWPMFPSPTDRLSHHSGTISEGRPLSPGALIITCTECWVCSHQSHAFTGLNSITSSWQMVIPWLREGKICPRALSYSKQCSCTVFPPSNALLGWEIQVGNSDRFWWLKLFISHLQAHKMATVV